MLEDGEEKASAQYGWDTKSIDPDEPLLPQIKDRLAIEQVRHERQLKQTLDAKRQQAFGITQYIWHTAGDNRVRSSHAVNEGKVFTWDTPPPTGYPGEDYNCRCYAEPVLTGAIDDPPIEPVYPEILLLGIYSRIGAIIGKIGRWIIRLSKPNSISKISKNREKAEISWEWSCLRKTCTTKGRIPRNKKYGRVY